LTEIPTAGLELKIPRHLAIIMDGNGRWAKARGKQRIAGHREGVKATREIVEVCGELGIDYLTLYTFSTENWKRPRSEVSALMKLLVVTIGREVESLDKNNVHLSVIGRLDDLDAAPRNAMKRAMERLSKNDGLHLILALSYGGRSEIIDAVNQLLKKSRSEVSEEEFSRTLYTGGIPDPDLLIRTSGEFRLSNFLLWQTAYSEIVVTKTLWPDFKRNELMEALREYSKRDRRFGKTRGESA
jgi:undecaprenyl diphosphate synthase